MKHRFRYLDERGQQVEVADLSALREHARAGKVDDDTLLYDSLTDEWAPASAHSAYRLLDDPLARGPDAGDGPSGAAAAEGSGPATAGGEGGGGDGGRGEGGHVLREPGGEPAFPDLEVTLALEDEVESTDEVVEKLLRERERDREGDRVPGIVGRFSEHPEPVREDPAPSSADDDPWKAVRHPPGPRPPDPDDEPIRPRRRPTPRRPATGARASPDAAPASSPRGWRRIEVPGPVVVLGAVLLVVLSLYSLTRMMNPSGAAEASTGGAASALETVRTPANPAWAAAEGGAFRDMVEGVDSLRTVYSVERIPRSWLAGPYLADADDFPEVREYWDHYTEFVDAVRSQDTALFRRSFVARLQDQGVSGPIVSIRLASALERFRASQPARDTVYERMEDLASSALDLHDLLVERAADIVHDPVTEERASRQPILEAWSDDAYLRQSIWSLLDRITANLALLEYDAGSGRSDLTERLFQELRTRSVGRGEGDGAG